MTAKQKIELHQGQQVYSRRGVPGVVSSLIIRRGSLPSRAMVSYAGKLVSVDRTTGKKMDDRVSEHDVHPSFFKEKTSAK